jgi:GT2 family glycosyltransferase
VKFVQAYRPLEVSSGSLAATDGAGHKAPMVIYAILTSFNRCHKTLECLKRLKASADSARVVLRAVLVDDGSSDGTACSVAGAFNWVTVLTGDGSLFWNRGMHKGIHHALRVDNVDALLWLNDDTNLMTDALTRLLEVVALVRRHHGRDGIVVGATCDPVSNTLTYGGSVISDRLHRFRFQKVHSFSHAMPCDTMNGNVVLCPIALARDLGNLDLVFEHAMGDLDYGLRARHQRHPIYVAPGFVGYCGTNSPLNTHADARLSLTERWRKLTHRKVLPLRSWLAFTRRHGGPLWPIYFVWPYLRLVTSNAFSGLRRLTRSTGRD